MQEWIDSFSEEKIYQLISSELEKYISTMIFVEINEAGFIVYNIPERWSDIIFNTVGKDIEIEGIDNGTLVLSY